MTNCKNCGAPVEAGALFCTECGSTVEEQAIEPEKTKKTTPVDPASYLPTSKILFIISSILSFINAGFSVLAAFILPIIGIIFLIVGIITAAFGVGFAFIGVGVYLLTLGMSLFIAILTSAIAIAVPGVLCLLASKKAFDNKNKSSRNTWVILTIAANASVYIDIASIIMSILSFPMGIITWTITNAAGVTGIIGAVLLLRAKDADMPEKVSDTTSEEFVEVFSDTTDNDINWKEV